MKEEYIKKISKLGDRYGNTLIDLLDYYNKFGLRELTLEEVKYYYENVLMKNIENNLEE